MGLWDKLLPDIFKDVADLADQAIDDDDMRSKLIGKIEQANELIKKELLIIELQTKTIPWVDALHKMGRQLQWYITAVIVGISMLAGHEITSQEAMLLGGVSIAYQLIKGKGSK